MSAFAGWLCLPSQGGCVCLRRVAVSAFAGWLCLPGRVGLMALWLPRQQFTKVTNQCKMTGGFTGQTESPERCPDNNTHCVMSSVGAVACRSV